MTMACEHADTTIHPGRFGTWPRGILKTPTATQADLNYESRPAGEVVPLRANDSPPPEENVAPTTSLGASRRSESQAAGNGGSDVFTVRRSVKFHLTDEQIGERDTLSRYRKRERGGWTGWFTHWKRLLAAVLQRMQPALTTPASTPNLRLSVSALGWAWETEDVDPAPWRVSPPPLSPEGFDRLDLGSANAATRGAGQRRGVEPLPLPGQMLAGVKRRRWEERERPAAPQPQRPRQAWAVAGLCLAREAMAALSGCAAGLALALALLAAWYFGLRDSFQKRPAQRAPEQPAEAD